MKIGNLEVSGYAALAPMAGVADRAMRELCISYGASFCISELVSSKGVSMGDRKSKELMSVYEKERPMAVQLFGCEPDIEENYPYCNCGQKIDWSGTDEQNDR